MKSIIDRIKSGEYFRFNTSDKDAYIFIRSSRSSDFDPGYIAKITPGYSRPIKEHHCNIRKFTRTGIQVYVIVCGKVVNVLVKYSGISFDSPVGGTADTPAK